MMAVMLATWTEVLRKRVLLVTAVLTLAFFVLDALGAYAVKHLGSGTHQNLADQVFLAMSLYISDFVVGYLAIFSAAGTVFSEIESGILLSILPRPVARWRVYMGKWLGYAIWAVVYGLLVYWVQIFIVGWQFGFSGLNASTFYASGEWVLIPLILTTLSILGSTYAPSLATGISVMLLFSFGLMGGIIEAFRIPTATDLIANIGMMISFIIPTDAMYRLLNYDLSGGASAFASTFGPFGSPIVPNHLFVVYVLVYIGFLLIWGIRRFTKMDI